MNIAIIPARGGSKRLPGKNIRTLAGKPLIAWTIEAALKSEIYDHVFVNTDCKVIADTALQAGAEVPFLRPEYLSGDEATTDDVVAHFVKWYEKEFSAVVNTVSILQPTSPLRGAAHIKEAWKLFHEKGAGAVVSVCELEYPWQFINQLDDSRCMDGFLNPEDMKRSQDLKPYYRLNGAIYLIKREYVGRLKNLYGKDTFAYVMPIMESIDIDTMKDFMLAEFWSDK